MCTLCKHEFILPIQDAKRLLEWAEEAPYERLARFVSNSGASGHNRNTIDQLVRIVERRRWTEEDRVRSQLATEGNTWIALTHQQRVWKRADLREERKRTLLELRALEPGAFESFIADLFRRQGYNASAVGGPADFGVDVEVRRADGSLWAVAQCKRYAQHCRVTAAHVMAFCGAFMLSKAECGFIFTTGELTRHAKKAAGQFNWLTVHSGGRLVEYAESVSATTSVEG